MQTHGNVGSALGYQEASPYQVILAPYNFEGGQQILPQRFYGVLPQPTLGSISYENALPSLLQHDYSYSAHSQHTSELNYANVAQHCLPQPQSSFSTVHLTEQELPPTLWQVNETFCSSHEAQTASEVCPCVRCQALFPFACGTEDIQQPTFPHGTNVPVFTAPDNGLFLHPQDQEVVQHSAEQETVVLDYRMDVHESQSHTDLPCTLRNQRRFSASDAPVADRRIPGRMRLNSEPVHIEILEDTLFFVKNTSASIRTYASPNLNEWGIKHPRGIIFQSEKSIVCCFFFESGVRWWMRLYWSSTQVVNGNVLHWFTAMLDWRHLELNFLQICKGCRISSMKPASAPAGALTCQPKPSWKCGIEKCAIHRNGNWLPATIMVCHFGKWFHSSSPFGY